MPQPEKTTDAAVGLATVEQLIDELYIPLAEIERDIPWRDVAERRENDAEHSFSLALIGAALGERLGLRPEFIALYATFHDAKERYCGDTSFMDLVGRLAKDQREAESLATLEINFAHTPILATAIKAYEAQLDEESRFVYALDKLLATAMIVRNKGRTWKDRGYTFEQYKELAMEKLRPKIAAHPLVLRWYDELFEKIEAHKDQLFLP